MGLRLQLQSLEQALARIEGTKTDPTSSRRAVPVVPVPTDPANEVSLTHVRALVRAFEASTDEKDRERILDSLTCAHSMYAETTHDLQFLPFFRGLILGSESATQRKNALIALHGVGAREVVDLLQELLEDGHAEVRFYAAEALPWVSGAEKDRALRLLAGALDHRDAEVRRIAALSLGVVVGDPLLAEPLLRRLGTETEDRTLAAVVFAVGRLLPTDGPTRIRELLPTFDRSRAERIEGFLQQ